MKDPYNLKQKHPDWEIKAELPDKGLTPKLVWFGNSGHVIDWNKNCHQSGYDTPENFFALSHWWAHSHLHYRDPAPYEGCPWIDKRPALLTPQGIRLVLAGPMCNVDLADDEVDECPEPSEFLAAGLQGSFKTLLKLNEAQRKVKQSPGALDYVSIREYARMWKEVGASVGRIRNGEFVNENI